MEKLLKHLTNAPVAIALAFLLVGSPAAPVAKMLTGLGTAEARSGTPRDWDMVGRFGHDGCSDTHRGCDWDGDGTPNNSMADIYVANYWNVPGWMQTASNNGWIPADEANDGDRGGDDGWGMAGTSESCTVDAKAVTFHRCDGYRQSDSDSAFCIEVSFGPWNVQAGKNCPGDDDDGD